jgi:hypothetical protein
MDVSAISRRFSGTVIPAIRSMVMKLDDLALALFMARVGGTNDAQTTAPANEPAMHADLLNGSFDFHVEIG